MVRVSVLYPNRSEARFDHEYYRQTHVPMVKRLLGGALRSCAVERGLGGEAPGSPPPFVAMCHLGFASVEAFGAAFGPHLPAIEADVPKYTDIEPVVQVSEVVM